ncbi:SDR family oxidoreductase [Mycobacterium paraintracellulare]|uniref:SDR family oxidoreductase n=1 Tax=Mycobacterium paraintracellulare TaxID=1138383 RepID=UPI001916230F|nr:SDR family oxidoreductase [Mycobacterium paraintracellulare]
MSERSLVGKRIVVVGASAGIGRAFAIRAGKEGAKLVLSARRSDKLAEVVAVSGDATAVGVDVCSFADCVTAAQTAKDVLGEIDLLVYSAGYAPLKMMVDTEPEDWTAVMNTNVIGLHQVVRSHLPVMTPSAILAALSSDSIRSPHHGLGAYSTSKAAMERLLVGWRLEHPGYRFTCVEVAGTVPTDFTSAFDPDLLGTVVGDWMSRGLVQQSRMTPEAVADVLAGVFGGAIDNPDVGLDYLSVKSPSGPMKL